jgi:8-oxo-dGTP pyrophosphatase MutT (NUDIX family)
MDSQPATLISSQRHGPWEIHQRQTRFQNQFIEVVEDAVTRPDGSPGHYTTVSMKAGVTVLPLDSDGNVHLARQFRYAAGRQTLELPTGAVEAGEEPLDAARRELREELGIESHQLTSLAAVDLDTSIVRCTAWLFLAQGLHTTAPDPDPTEAIERVSMPFHEALQLVMDGQITHAPSCVLLLKAARHLRM